MLDTIIFHTFVLMCLFNQINCRVITPNDNFNLFTSLCNNRYFWVIFVLEMAVQQLFVYWASGTLGSSLLGMSGLTWRQQTVCHCLAAATLIVQVVAKRYVPLEPFDIGGMFSFKKVNLEHDVDDNVLTRMVTGTTTGLKKG